LRKTQFFEEQQTMKRLVRGGLVLALLVRFWLPTTVAAEGTVKNFRVSDSASGAAMTNFPSGISTVYVIFDYADMQNETITVKVYGPGGVVLYEKGKSYTGSGTEAIPIAASGGAFADAVSTNPYVSQRITSLGLAQSIVWTVGKEPTPAAITPPPATVPPAAAATPVPSQPSPPAGLSQASLGTLALVALAFVVLLAILIWALRRLMGGR
jgi:hypothetical protein